MKRRRSTTNDCDISMKATCDERDEMRAASIELNMSMSDIIRVSVNAYLDRAIFETQSKKGRAYYGNKEDDEV